MMTKSGSRRAATAARIFAAIASAVDQRLAREVPAALRHFLVFEVNPRDARRLEQPDGALDVQRFAEAGVGVAEQRQRRGLGGELGLG